MVRIMIVVLKMIVMTVVTSDGKNKDRINGMIMMLGIMVTMMTIMISDGDD